jgi:arylsulfatase A-like enzyme
MTRRRAIVVVLDGLRRDLLGEEATPELHRFADAATEFAAHRSVFPSATRVVSACFATGCHPARHGLQGNAVALMEEGRLVPHDVGRPDFMDHKRRVTDRSLHVPTMAERLSRAGREAMVFSNVSPGAARAHDPDGHGWVFHRACSFAPGLRPLTGVDSVENITLDSAGDARLATRFLDGALAGREAALGVLWLGEPDHAQHGHPLGSPECRAAIAGADACFGRVRAAVEARRAAGEDFLLIACSDHGHQTVTGVVDIEAEFCAAGLKRGAADDALLAASNGTAALVYLHPDRAADAPAVLAFLRSQSWAGRVLAGEELAEIGHVPSGGLLCAVSLRSEETPNAHGVPGSSLAAKPMAGKPDRLGCGQHGGLGRYEQMPFLLVEGPGFAPGARVTQASSAVDLAPSILRHLGLPHEGCDGRPLQHSTTEDQPR